jgi:hypothetical protein
MAQSELLKTSLNETRIGLQVLGFISPGLKRPGREATRLPPSSAEVKSAWSNTFTFPCFMMCFFKHSYNFTLTFSTSLYANCVCGLSSPRPMQDDESVL